MGKPMYNFGKTANIKAQQQKQMDKASKRRIAKQSKANIKSSTPNEDSAYLSIVIKGKETIHSPIFTKMF